MATTAYAKYAQAKARPSSLFRDCVVAFMVGGAICALGQAFLNLFVHFGVKKTDALVWVPVTLVFLSCLFTGIGWYDKLAKHAGAGTLVPITGFANAMASPAIDNTAEGLVLGLGAKIFIICGPVILYGTVFSLILGLIAVILKLFGIDMTGVV